MKRIFYLLFFMISGLAAQSQAYEGSIQYNKQKQAALAIDYSYTPEAVENALIDRLAKLGYKPKEEKGILNRDKGFLVFKNAFITDISNDKMDYIVKVERKSRKESDEAVLYMIINKNDANVIKTMDAYDIGRAKSFLNNMIPDIEAADLELQIKAQAELVAKAEKKLKGLQDDHKDLEQKITANAKAQEDTQKDIETQKKNLELLQGKRIKN